MRSVCSLLISFLTCARVDKQGVSWFKAGPEPTRICKFSATVHVPQRGPIPRPRGPKRQHQGILRVFKAPQGLRMEVFGPSQHFLR